MRQKYACYDQNTGRILHATHYLPDNLPDDNGAFAHIAVDEEIDLSRRFIADGVLIEKGDAPSVNHTFDYTTKQWIDPRTPETEWPLIRAERDRRLAATDWTQLPDVPLETKDAWAAYRQALRDITLQPDPFNIVWPLPPT